MKLYNKLVRDKIPDIIKNNNENPITYTLNNEDYLVELNKKLQEEVQEYLTSGDVEELADIEEVIRAILDAKGVSYENLEDIRLTKANKRGTFKNKIFLERVE